MPSYKVLETGFFDGRQYSPEGKRPVLHTDKSFPKGRNKKEQVPSWLERIKDETAAQKGDRNKSSDVAVKKAEDDQKEIDNASFLGEGEKSSTVETL